MWRGPELRAQKLLSAGEEKVTFLPVYSHQLRGDHFSAGAPPAD